MFPEQAIPQQEPEMPENSDRIHLHFDHLREEINAVLKADADSRNSIQRLERELSVYQRAYSDLDAERKRFEILKLEADKKIENLDNQLKGHRVIALIDGDGVIFNSTLISEGRSGGHLAAQKLSDSIIQHLNTINGTNQYQLWVYVFLNKRGLTDTFGRARLPVAKHRFEEFIIGFNQAAERFMMIDVGSEKEAADAKIKALLEDEIRLPQTEKIIFGGCHDNGYVTTLRSQITAGFKNKIILLRGYTDMAIGISDLDLPSFSVPELFIPQKLIVPTGSYQNMPHLTSLTKDTSPHFSEPEVDDIPVTIASPPSIIQEGFEVLPFASVDAELPAPKTPPSYSSAVQTAPQKRAITPELDSSDSTSSSDGSDDGLPNVRPSLTNVKSRRLNPNIPLSKHKPPPCTLFCLSTCKFGADCKFAHDYILEADHFKEIRVNAKKSPCPSKNKGDVCVWGESCCYGHHCPLTTKCHFFKQNRCKFVGADMHKDPKSQSVDTA